MDFDILNCDYSPVEEINSVEITKRSKKQFWSQSQLVIDPEIIEDIFGQPEVVNLPIALYSIAGAFRKGKSFLLNLLLRYLKFLEKKKSEDWLADLEDDVGKGFDWRGGNERHTEGIVMTNSPIIVTTKQNQKVAVFLMDTQGVFDSQTSVNSDSVLFALSSLISSYQMYNVPQNIDSSDLHHLRVFSDFGMMTREKKAETPYQALSFMVRDWDDEEVGFGVKGGEKYLATVFSERKEFSLEHKSVCKNIQSSFRKVECYLLPDPGKKVRRRGPDNQVCLIKDIDEDFREYCDQLAHHLFDDIVVKELNGVVLRGGDMINLSLLYSGKLAGRNIDPKLLYEANAEGTMAKVMGECEEFYRQEIAYVKTAYKPGGLRKIHDAIMQKTLEKFDSQPKVGEDDFIIGYRNILEEMGTPLFEMFKQKNTSITLGLHAHFRKKAKQSLKRYKEEMDRHLKVATTNKSQYLDESEFEKKETEAREKALLDYETNTKSDNAESSTPSLEQDRQVELEIEQEERTALNDIFLNLAKMDFAVQARLQEEKAKAGLWKISTSVVENYDTAMADLSIAASDFKKKHDKFIADATSNNKRRPLYETPGFIAMWENTKLELDKRLHLYTAINDLNQTLKSCSTECLKLVNRVKNVYTTNTYKVYGKKYLSENDFRELQDAANSCATTELNENLHMVTDRIPSEKLALEVVKRENMKLSEKNNLLKRKKHLTFFEKRLELEERYLKKVNEICDGANPISIEDFEAKNERFRKDVLEEFEATKEEPVELYEEESSSLQKNIRGISMMATKKLNLNLKNVRNSAELLCHVLAEKYNNDTDKLLDGKYAEEDDLKLFHKEFKGAAVKNLKTEVQLDEFKKEFSQKLELMLDRLNLDCWNKINHFKRKFYTRKVTRASSLIGAVIGGFVGLCLAGVEIAFVPGAGWAMGAVTVTKSTTFGAAAGNWFSNWLKS